MYPRRQETADQRHRDLGLDQAAVLEEMAAAAQLIATPEQTQGTRQLASRCTRWLQEEAARVRRWSTGLSGKVPLSRLRLTTLRLEKHLRELAELERELLEHRRQSPFAVEEDPDVPRLERELALVRGRVSELLDQHDHRLPYEEMVHVLRELSVVEDRREESEAAERFADMARRLEVQLETGALDNLDRDQVARDRNLLQRFQQQLAQHMG